MQLEGSLSRFALRELLELSVASLVNGALEVQAPRGVHQLFFVEGECVHATSPDANGFDALWPLFELKDGTFRFVAGKTSRERSIALPTLELIEQAEALAHQWAKVRPYIADLDIVPQLTTPAEGEQVRIYEEDWPVLSCVDGTRTIAAIAQQALLDPLQVCIGLLRLKERGLLRLDQRRPAIEQARVEHSGPANTTHQPSLLTAPKKVHKPSSFFAKLLVSVPQEVLAMPVPTTNSVPTATSVAATPAAPATPTPNSVTATAYTPAKPLPDKPTEYDDILSLIRS